MKTLTLKIWWYVLCFLVASSLFETAYATGVLYVRPRWSDDDYQKVWIKSIDVQVDIQDQVAETHMDQTFFNELNVSAEAIYIFPLPENAMITELVYWVNGERFVAEIRERQDAINAYNQKLREWLDPALLEYLGDNLFRLSIVPVNAQSEFRAEITYIELLNYDFGVSKYKLLMNTLDLSSQPLETVQVQVDANAQNKFKYFRSPSHENSAATKITKLDDYHYSMEFGDENYYPDTDLRIEMETIRDDVEFSVLTYTPTAADSFGIYSFYALWITPPDSVAEEEILPKDMVITADVSSSMEGERISQVQESIDIFLNKLSENDRFNIITFGTHVIKFKNDLVQANTQNISDAHDFVYQMYALGMTNISAALDSSLNQSYRENASKNLIFLTDGSPTIGTTNPETIVENSQQNNTAGVRIFSFGIGETANISLLVNLSINNNGYATTITSDDSIALVIANHFNRISKPVMTDIGIDFGGLQVRDQYPKNLGDLFWGTQILELGNYSNNGNYPITLTGRVNGESQSFTKTYMFSDESGGFRFVPRLWAQKKVDYLLDLIEIYGESNELVSQIIELSITFQILTPYTAFYTNPDESKVMDSRIVPKHFKLYPNYPNPFNPETTIKYTLPTGQASYHVIIKIIDALGRVVMTLKNEQQKPGLYTVKWNGQNAAGISLSSGVYFCVLQADQYRAIQKMLLVR